MNFYSLWNCIFYNAGSSITREAFSRLVGGDNIVCSKLSSGVLHQECRHDLLVSCGWLSLTCKWANNIHSSEFQLSAVSNFLCSPIITNILYPLIGPNCLI